MSAFIFSATFVWNISYSKKNSVRYYHKCTYSLFPISENLHGEEVGKDQEKGMDRVWG